MNWVFLRAGIAGLILLFSNGARAEEVDPELLNSLKIEATHNLTRLKSLKAEKKNNRIYDDEREKALGSFLEEQEKWELSRERGVAEYRKQKATLSPADGGPEFLEDQKIKEKAAAISEKNRDVQVRTRNRVLSENPGVVAHLENEELGLLELRPRYELRKRAQNKWVKGGTEGRGGSAGSKPPTDSGSDFPPAPPPMDYGSAPSPMDSYEEVPPPPPPSFDYGNAAGAMPYDAGFGDVPPPPPPPPVDYDF